MAAGNSALVMETGSGWSRGLNNLLRAELGQWFGTNQWWVQILIWASASNLIYLMASLSIQGADSPGIAIFNIMLGIAGPIGVTIIMQNVIGGERRQGTAAWILSKPVARESFILSKLIGNALGITVTMVIAQGVIAYLITGLLVHVWLPVPGFIAGLFAQWANIWFYLTMTVMLGALFEHPAPVVGIPMAVLFSQNFLANTLAQKFPTLASAMPWFIGAPPGGEMNNSVATSLMMGQTPPTLLPVYFALAAGVVFVVVALWSFRRQEL
jgi:ABC-type transport system involved in multi-copper enzyme maturation permease subunit